MTLMQWPGLASLVVVVGIIVFAFRRAKSVKPDKDRKTEDWPKITQGGSS